MSARILDQGRYFNKPTPHIIPGIENKIKSPATADATKVVITMAASSSDGYGTSVSSLHLLLSNFIFVSYMYNEFLRKNVLDLDFGF
jgi:hypothetical protein